MKATRFVSSVFALTSLVCAVGLGLQREGGDSDWPMWGGSPDRNPVSTLSGLPTQWDVDSEDNVSWVSELGSQTYATPAVGGGKVFIGTNNDLPRSATHSGDRGVLMAFGVSDGKFLWQATSPKLSTGNVNDWEHVGVCSTPLIEGERLYYVTNRCELVCLDSEGFSDGENDGPFAREEHSGDHDADIVWQLDMIAELGVFPHNMSNSSPVALGDLVFVGTSNGQNEEHTQMPAPDAPAIVAVNKKTGQVVWSDNSPGDSVLNGQWASPMVVTIGGVDQVVMGQGDGWVRGYEAHSGLKLWEFDTNPKEATYPESRNEILATAVSDGKYVYIANGQDPENGEGKGHLYCIDATKRGDITEIGIVWQYDEIRRSISSPVVLDGLLYYPDFSGFLHCLDAETGEVQWVHDTFAAIWGSPVVIDAKIYLGDEDGDVTILKTGRKKEILGEVNMGSAVYSTPVPAGGKLFIATLTHLYALESKR